jgi:hypothetical protein
MVVPTSSRKLVQRGHGVPRRYSSTGLVCLRVVKRLCESGVSPLKVKAAIRELHALASHSTPFRRLAS